MAASQHKSPVTVREATQADVPAMVDVHFNAFRDSPLNRRCFPESPESRAYWTKWIEGYIGVPDIHMMVALASARPATPPSGIGAGSGTGADTADTAASIVGWARWVRRSSQPQPVPTLTVAAFPPGGESALALDFFQTARDASERLVGGRDYWFLSMIMTRHEARRRGIGAALMRFGVERADEDRLVAYLNASEDGRPLYELFGFKSIEQHRFDELGVTMYHMLREPKAN
ncbi:acyl-CoA N-acyltransferase [Dactylonectria estremocensis]|uniref:Acyl-CoA N-acyltransferase n=1 Tax=Dactylonectria estremocensis TaxID=1079267 RepID=A0A9P9F6K4_9HYPO|nr:acyl-CoA N-acyltransferase [Dactylonectria estremocensis]